MNTCRLKDVFIENQLQTCFKAWYLIRLSTIDALQECKAAAIEALNSARKSTVGFSSTSLVVGGIMGIVGLALIPVTFGASAIVSAVGAGVSATASGSAVSHKLYAMRESYKQLQKAQKFINLDQQFSIALQTLQVEYNKAIAQKMIEAGALVTRPLVPVGQFAGQAGAAAAQAVSLAKAGGLTAGKAFTQAGFEFAAEGGLQTTRLACAGARFATGALALIVSVPLDIYQIISNGTALYNSDEEGKNDKDKVVKYLYEQCEELLKGKYTSAL